MNYDRRILAGTAIPVAAVAGGLAATLMLGGPTSRRVIAQDTAAITTEQRNTASSLEGAFMKIADTVGPATVSITARIEPTPTRGSGLPQLPGDEDDESPFGDLFGPFRRGPQQSPRGGRASGSGVIVRPEGYILTNDHVVSGVKEGAVKVTLDDGRQYTGKVFGDPLSDLAVVKIDTGKPLPYVRLADSNRLKVGQWAVAIGSPFGQQNTMTAGIVSALHRKSEIGRGGDGRYYPNLIQTDASINPGNSGGPLLNINGEMIGVNVAIYSPSGANAGIGFAIPSNTARSIMEQLITTGKVTRGYLGIRPNDIPAALRDRVGTSKGARIESVGEDTPAGRAGIQAGDIIIRFGDRDIEGEVDLRDVISATAPGTRAPVTLLRDGKTLNVTVTVGALPEDRVAAVAPSQRRPAATSRLGMEGDALTAEVARELKIAATTRGVVVKRVMPGSPAFEAGLQTRDIVTSVNGKPVATFEAINREVGTAKPGDLLTLRVLRADDVGGKTTELVVDVTIP